MNRRDFLKMAFASTSSFLIDPRFLFAEESKGRVIVFGGSTLEVKKNSIVGAQVDRVIRDIAWTNSKFDRRKNPYGYIFDRSEIVPYMEGQMARELIDAAQVKVFGLAPSFAYKRADSYYTKDTKGKYSLRVDPSKIAYPTNKPFEKTAIKIVDTHGFNMLLQPALEFSKTSRLDLVIGCMDLPSKAQAALELSWAGINCFGPCDRFAYQLLGYRNQPETKGIIMGSAPIRKNSNGAVIGGQKVAISEKEPVIVQITQALYDNQYCDTASRYFKQLKKVYNLDLNLLETEAVVGETEKLVVAAEKNKSTVIGARVFSKADAAPLSDWLNQNNRHRLILFHSAAYEPGYEMFFKFPTQTSFGDLDPKIIG